MLRKVTRISLLTTFFGLVSLGGGIAKSGEKQKPDWLSPEEMSARYVISKKPIIVDIYTNWCHYCRVMDNQTWQHDSVVNYLRDRFYMVKIDAESKHTFQWMGEPYEYIPRYKLNQLAIKLLEGNMTYPGTVIIPENGEPEVLRGAFTAGEMEMILKYYGEKWNERISPEVFQRKFSRNWK